LEILTQREKEIEAFVPKKYYKLRLKFIYKNKELYAEYSKAKMWDKKEAEKIYSECKDQEFNVDKITKTKSNLKTPHPFDLSSLQSESYRCFGYSHLKTQNIAQNFIEINVEIYLLPQIPQYQCSKFLILIYWTTVTENLTK